MRLVRRRLKVFKYRTNDDKVQPFYARDQDSADRNARRWAKRMGFTRITRLRRKPSRSS